jgi:hypothetical protein
MNILNKDYFDNALFQNTAANPSFDRELKAAVMRDSL